MSQKLNYSISFLGALQTVFFSADYWNEFKLPNHFPRGRYDWQYFDFSSFCWAITSWLNIKGDVLNSSKTAIMGMEAGKTSAPVLDWDYMD